MKETIVLVVGIDEGFEWIDERKTRHRTNVRVKREKKVEYSEP